jgi:hypothetical protein
MPKSKLQFNTSNTMQSPYTPLSLLALAQMEGEDACLTGMTRSLGRRLLALNVPGVRRPVQRIAEPSLLPVQRIA